MGRRKDEAVEKVWSVFAIALAACLPQQVMGEAPADGPGEARWYVSAGAGANWMPGMRQVGHNRDGTCYPHGGCIGVAVDGYRWAYDLLAGDGWAFEVAIGYLFDGIRVELSASQRKNRLEQGFRSIAYRDGSAIADPRPRLLEQQPNLDRRAPYPDPDAESLP